MNFYFRIGRVPGCREAAGCCLVNDRVCTVNGVVYSEWYGKYVANEVYEVKVFQVARLFLFYIVQLLWLLFFVVQGASKVALKSFQSCYYYSFLSFFCDILWMFFLPIQLGKWKLDRKVVLTSEYYKQFEPWNGWIFFDHLVYRIYRHSVLTHLVTSSNGELDHRYYEHRMFHFIAVNRSTEWEGFLSVYDHNVYLKNKIVYIFRQNNNASNKSILSFSTSCLLHETRRAKLHSP